MQRCSEKAFAMCPTRHLCGTIEEATFADDSECSAFNREVEGKPMTHADKVRAMSDQELAEFFCPETYDRSPWCVPVGRTKCGKGPCKKCMLKWLQQPAEGE